MSKMNVSSFRTKLKEMLDLAESGETVTIERNGVVFYLATRKESPTESQENITRPPWADLERMVLDVLQEVYALKNPLSQTQEKKVLSQKISTSPQAILREIDELKAEAAERMEQTQDPDEQYQINAETKTAIDDLWIKYHQTKQEQENER